MKYILFIVILISLFYSCTSVDSLIKEQNLDKASEFCQKEKEQSSDGLENPKQLCYEKIADDYFKKGDFVNAEKFYDIDFAANIKKRKKSSFQIAEAFLSKKLYIKALKYYDKTNRRDEGYLKVSDSYIKENQLFKALSLYRVLDNKKGIESIAKKYSENGEYLRALKLFKELNLKNKYAFKFAKKLFTIKSYLESAELYKFVGNLKKSRNSYKKFAYSLLDGNDFVRLLDNVSPIVSILLSDDYLFIITQKGDIYQGYIYENNLKKVFSIPSKKEKVIDAKYLYKNNKIVLLTNAGLVFYDLVNKKITRRLNKKITAFAITENENTIITANENIISIRDFDSLDEVLFFKKHSSRVNEILISKNKVFSAGKDKLIRVWDIETGTELFVLRGHFLEIKSLSLSKDSRFLASGSKDKTVKIWDLKKKKLKENFKLKYKVNSVVFSNDSSKLIVSVNNRLFKVIDLIEGGVKDSLLYHSTSVLSVGIDKNNNFLYSGSKNGALFVSIMDRDLLIEKLFNKSMLNKNEYLKVAEMYFKNKKYKMSANYYQLSNKKDKGISKIGDAYFDLENYDEALKYYSLLNDKEHFKKIADTYFKLGDYNKASEYFFKSENKIGVLKSAKMFLYEENYYDSIKLYIKLSKSYDLETEKEKRNAIYLTVSDIFLNMKEISYMGSNDEKIIKEVNKKLKSWYESRFEFAEEYYNKAEYSEKGYLVIGDFLRKAKEFDKSISFYEKLEDEKNSKKLVKDCQKEAAEYNYEKTGEYYKKLLELIKTDGDWALITKNFNNSFKYVQDAKKYYKILRNRKKLRKIKRIERKLKGYKKSLGIE